MVRFLFQLLCGSSIINSGGNNCTEMSSWCCSISSQLSCLCSKGKMCSDGTGPASFKFSSLIVPSSNKTPSTASKMSLVSRRFFSFSKMRHGLSESQASKPSQFGLNMFTSEFACARSPGNQCCRPRCVAPANAQPSFRNFVGPFISTFHEFFTHEKSVVCTLLSAEFQVSMDRSRPLVLSTMALQISSHHSTCS